MEEYQKRVVKEHEDLVVKTTMLRKFLVSNDVILAQEEWVRLIKQEMIMGHYIGVLEDRMKAFE